jgi:uncharacterized protein YcbK (DUF882 family)
LTGAVAVPQAQGLMLLRRAALGAAFLLATASVYPAFAGDDEGMAAEPESAAAAPAADATADAPSGKRASVRKRRGKSRRGPKFSGRVVAEEELRTEPLPRPSGNLEIQSLAHPTDRAKVNIYNKDGSYSLEAIEELNFVLRCRRTDDEKAIDIQLLTWMSLIYDHFGGKPLQIVSAYRNQRKQSSNHAKGRAMDIKIEGVSPKLVRAFAQTLDRGGMGIGLYPRSEFVHIDVRSPPSYRWIDNSPPNSNAAEKRPPRGWKRKKLES